MPHLGSPWSELAHSIEPLCLDSIKMSRNKTKNLLGAAATGTARTGLWLAGFVGGFGTIKKSSFFREKTSRKKMTLKQNQRILMIMH
jgi:hypothetical protein